MNLRVSYSSINFEYPLKVLLTSDEFLRLQSVFQRYFVKQLVLAALSFVSLRSKLTKWLFLITKFAILTTGE